MSIAMKVFLDDSRETPEGWFRTYTVKETLYWLSTGKVEEVSLDNDLGEGLAEGFTVLNELEIWIDDDPNFPIPIIHIHSANAVRAQSMRKVAEKLDLVRQQQLTERENTK
jgi:hypothetical protein